MNIHYLQHVSFETPARIARWAERTGHTLEGVHLYAGDSIPRIEDVEGLIVMGGPMSVHDESLYPWMKKEKQLIKSMIEASKPVFGVCLGAQLIAEVLDASVEPMGYREIGWWPVRDNEGNDFTAFHWHGERFSLPRGAEHLYFSKAWEEQGFRFGKKCIGLQFHLEMDKAAIDRLLENCRDEITDSFSNNHTWVHTEKEILLFAEKMNYDKLMQILSDLLNPLFS